MHATAIDLATFDATRPGTLPDGWISVCDGKGSLRWPSADPTALQPNVPSNLARARSVVRDAFCLADGFVR